MISCKFYFLDWKLWQLKRYLEYVEGMIQETKPKDYGVAKVTVKYISNKLKPTINHCLSVYHPILTEPQTPCI